MIHLNYFVSYRGTFMTFLFFCLTAYSLNAQISIGASATTNWPEAGKNRAKVTLISNISTLNIEVNNGESISGPEAGADGKYIYSCICDVTDTNLFGFRISVQGKVFTSMIKVYIEEGQHTSYPITVEESNITLIPKITNANEVVPKEKTALITIASEKDNLQIKSLTGEKVEDPVKNENQIYEYKIFFSLPDKASQEIIRKLEFSINGSAPVLYEVGTLSPKQGVNIAVVVIGSDYTQHKTNADQLFMNGNYGEALAAYMEAQTSPDKPEQINLMDQITKVNNNIIALNKANTFYMGEKWAEAKSIYLEILANNPGDNFAAQQINECNIKLEPPKAFPPTVETGNISEIKANSVLAQGKIIHTGGLPVSSYGFCWSRDTEDPTIEDNKIIITGENDEFSQTLPELLPNRIYYIRAFAQNSAGISYGNPRTIQTGKGQPWTPISVRMQSRKPVIPSFCASNGSAIFFSGEYTELNNLNRVLADTKILKYDLKTKKWDIVNEITNSYNLRRNSPATVVGDIAYLATPIQGPSGPLMYGIIRYDMKKNSFLPVVNLGLKWESSTTRIVTAFSIHKKCYFLTSLGDLLCFNTEGSSLEKTGEAKLNVGLAADRCSSFSIDGLGYVVTNQSIYEFDPVKKKWTGKGSTPVNFYVDFDAFSIGDKGYVISVNSSNAYFYEFNPQTNSWKRRNTPKNINDAFGRGVNDTHAVIGTKNEIYLYDPLQEND